MRVKRVSDNPIVRIAGHAVQVTPKTQWVFLEIQTKSGLSGIGEASLNNRETQVLARAEAMAGALSWPIQTVSRHEQPGRCRRRLGARSGTLGYQREA